MCTLSPLEPIERAIVCDAHILAHMCCPPLPFNTFIFHLIFPLFHSVWIVLTLATVPLFIFSYFLCIRIFFPWIVRHRWQDFFFHVCCRIVKNEKIKPYMAKALNGIDAAEREKKIERVSEWVKIGLLWSDFRATYSVDFICYFYRFPCSMRCIWNFKCRMMPFSPCQCFFLLRCYFWCCVNYSNRHYSIHCVFHVFFSFTRMPFLQSSWSISL